MKWMLFCSLFLCAASSQAQTLHKCGSTDGVTAYRSGSCLDGEKLLAVRDGSPEIRTPAQLQALRERQDQPEIARHSSGKVDTNRRTKLRVSASTSGRRTANKDPCTSTKQARDDYERRRGIKITLAELSRWNSRVYDACKP